MPKQIGKLTLYSVDDLHEMLGISKLTLRTYLREGKIRARKLGVSWYVTEDAIREYFEEPQPESTPKVRQENLYRYIVQGVNDLVSETEICETIAQAIEILNEQAIISLFQVQIVERSSNSIIEVLKARDFLDRYVKA